MSAPVAGTASWPVLREIVLLWLGTLLLIRFVVGAVTGFGLPDLLLVLVPVLFMYTPLAVCRWRGVDPDRYPLALPAFRDGRAWKRALLLALAVVGVVAVPWGVAYHLWQTLLFGFEPSLTLPSSMLTLIGYHLFFVAIPEEMFYRGYLQSRLDELWPPRWRILGARLGPGWLLTCVLFAFGHSIVHFQWWHFAIVGPSLLFGWMRARSGGIVAGALFHAWCNVAVTTLDTAYGILPP